MDAMEIRARERYEQETDPAQREAYALAKRAGFDWYNTESSARRMAEHAAEEILKLKWSLRQVSISVGHEDAKKIAHDALAT